MTDFARLFRAEYGSLVAALMVHAGDIQLAEDSLQEAFVRAMDVWPDKGLPANPAGWLLTVARRCLIDKFRAESRHNHEATIRAVHDALASEASAEAAQPIPDERLALIFTCCHPALSEAARVALTLKTLCGLTAREIARAFLVSESTMNQRLTRAKRKIRDAGIRYQTPEGEALGERLPSVLSVIYLIYNESYSAFEGQTLTRDDLANEALRLARLLYRLLPEPEVAGLLALILFHDARRAARTTEVLAYVPLEKQDRSLWNASAIAEARALLLQVMAKGRVGPYQIQAAISALHSQANSWQETDWLQIILLYDELYKRQPSPVVMLNKWTAVACSGSPECAYKELNALQDELADYQPFFAARADIARQLGLLDQAMLDYQQAIKLTNNGAERDFLLARSSALQT